MTSTEDPDADRWPTVSVVMAVRNEAKDLRRSVEAVLAQRYPKPIEVVIAVARSRDDTERVAADLVARQSVTVVPNPAGTAPSGLNAAIRASHGAVIVRVDGHAELSDGYIQRAVETLRRTGAVNVGGIQRARGETPFEQALARAMTSKFGVGDAKFHYGGAEGPTDTVYLGVFDRTALERVGLYDERLARNQDYELNIRLREAGGTVWFDPCLEVSYCPRPTIGALARQYFDYGRWKRTVVRKHPKSLRWRQLAPPLATAAILTSVAIGVVRPRAFVVPAVYAIAVGAAAAASGSSASERARLTAIFPTMHLSWGSGFLFGRRPDGSAG